MKKLTGLWMALMWIALVPIFFMQVLAAIGIAQGGKMSCFLLVAAAVVLVAAAILFCALREKKGIAMIVAAVAAVLFIVVAITIYNTYELNLKVQAVGSGLTAGKFVVRHVSPLLVTLFMLFYWICWRADWKDEKARRAAKEPDHYLDLEGFSLSPLEEDSPDFRGNKQNSKKK